MLLFIYWSGKCLHQQILFRDAMTVGWCVKSAGIYCWWCRSWPRQNGRLITRKKFLSPSHFMLNALLFVTPALCHSLWDSFLLRWVLLSVLLFPHLHVKWQMQGNKTIPTPHTSEGEEINKINSLFCSDYKVLPLSLCHAGSILPKEFRF